MLFMTSQAGGPLRRFDGKFRLIGVFCWLKIAALPGLDATFARVAE